MFLISLGALVIISVPIVLGGSLPGDMRVLLAAMSIRNPALTQIISILTFMGSAIPTIVLCAGLTLLEWRNTSRAPRSSPRSGTTGGTSSTIQSLWRAAWPLIAYGGAMVTNITMRLMIERLPPRVDSIQTLLPELQAGFQRFAYPSGHAVTVLVAYGALAIIALRQSRGRIAALLFAIIVITGVGFGRLYLGVHWPSDVLAGYIVAIIWLITALGITRQSLRTKTA